MASGKILIACLLLAGCAVGPSPWSATYGVLQHCNAATDPALRERCRQTTLASSEDENIVRVLKLNAVTRRKCLAITDVRDRAIDFRFSPWYGYGEQQVRTFFLNSLPREPSIPPGATESLNVVLSDAEITNAVAFAFRWQGVAELYAENLKLHRACVGLPPSQPARQPTETWMWNDPQYQQYWKSTMQSLYGG